MCISITQLVSIEAEFIRSEQCSSLSNSSKLHSKELCHIIDVP